MKIEIVVIGKTSSKLISEIANEYLLRTKNCAIKTKIIQSRKQNLPVDLQRQTEGKDLLKAIGSNDFLILLDDKGQEFTSIEFAHWLEKHQHTTKNLVFAIGGAYGFAKEVYDRSNYLLSLSKMTFSHQIVRAIFAEQLYRATTIISGTPYHHEGSGLE
ncbi:MAG: 23S rRNA (pseudouridine(1915)-N(3))-methyltransferase RlmH [Prevotellaceae bacterium]|jgi:23S rRNA (pseudouridine1915-N3)-methyltransferase|nr:23S rRNA (pseudouridine(1915)-N(3))-methyltransferase RlmH [Prevotellaceae bacterium]